MKITQRATRGFSLVEVVLALGVAAFCLVAIFGLLPVGVNSNRTSIEQTVAANIASMVMADLQALPKGYTTSSLSPRFRVPAPPMPGNGTATHSFFLGEDGTVLTENGTAVAVDGIAKAADNPRYRITVNYNVPAANQAYFSVPTQVLITWPALADPNAMATPANFSGSFELSGSLARP